jgi:hypothetical protein
MVLDVKALSWAARNEIDTAKLKTARVPMYGKWYFPEIPENVALVNLETGDRQTFNQPMLAGENVWVAVRDLKRAGLGGFENEPDEPEPEAPHVNIVHADPLIAMARLPGGDYLAAPAYPQALLDAEEEPLPGPLPEGVHMPLASISPMVLAVGISIALLGLITHVLVLLIGLVWVGVGAAGWIRIGQLESRAAATHGAHH